MYERFTDRARKVFQLANQEAQRFNHEYIGTEHVLLGLIKEGSGVASVILKNLDVDLRRVRLEVEKLVQSGPDMYVGAKLPHTPRVKKVIEYTMEAARQRGDRHIGTEHILIGLCKEPDGVAHHVLKNLGVVDAVLEDIDKLIGVKPEVIKEAENVQQEMEAAIADQDWERASKLRDEFRQKMQEDKNKTRVQHEVTLWRIFQLLVNRRGDASQTLSEIAELVNKVK